MNQFTLWLPTCYTILSFKLNELRVLVNHFTKGRILMISFALLFIV